MGRGIPIPFQAHPLLHPDLVMCLAIAWTAATMAVVLSICATCNRKSSSKPSSPSAESETSSESDNTKPASETAATAAAVQRSEQEEKLVQAALGMEGPVTVIEMAPDIATHGPIPPTVLPTSASRRKLSLSFGRGLPEKLRASRKERKEDVEDSLWKKTIILGEKCKVAGEEEEDERHYHPRSPRSRQTSRNNSFAYPDEMPTRSGAMVGG